MKKTRMRFMALVLTIVLISTAMPIDVFANQSELMSKGGIRVIKQSNFGDVYNMEYIYEENGEIFKAIENINEDFSKVKTKIFKKVNNEFILFEELETIIKENNDNFEVLTMNLINGEQKINKSRKPVEQFEMSDRSLKDSSYSTSSTSPYPRYETYRIKNGNVITDALQISAITALLVTALGVNKVTTEYVKKTIATLAASAAATIFVKGHTITYYTNRSYISIYLEARETDPMFKYWDSIYSDKSRTSLISEKEYDSGVDW